jgi:hypothetical protein
VSRARPRRGIFFAAQPLSTTGVAAAPKARTSTEDLMSHRLTIALLFSGFLALPLVAIAPIERATAASPLQYDTDKDGTLDLAEVKAAASTAFDRLDKDSDGTLDRKELRSRLSAKELAEADTDHEGTISKDEYLALVEKLFNAADTDHEGTLSPKELHSKAGRALMRLLK